VVELTTPDELAIPTTIPFSDLFTAHDDDGASGDVVQERVLFDECLLFEGLEYGDGDGLLSDELAVLDGTLFCEAIARCGLPEIDEPEVRFEAIDCGGNEGKPTRVIRVFPVVSQSACQTELALAKDSGSIAAVPVAGGAFIYLIRYHHGVTTSE
jgi:hypothetical protein